MNKHLTFAYSTCPNDTFAFNAISHNLTGSNRQRYQTKLLDIETLNQNARSETFEISKLSFAALGFLQDKYGLLRSGSALGRGCGPLIIGKTRLNIKQLKSTKIAIPGEWTTANLLLGLYLNSLPETQAMPFDKIMPAIQNNEFSAGVIIHEGRFTFHDYNLMCIKDLGEWWEEKTSLPIPLGGIAIRRNISQKIATQAETDIKKSVQYAFKNRKAADNYIKQHAQEIEPSVIKRHIDLYVNNFSIDIGAEGESAINKLFNMAQYLRIMPKSELPLFAVNRSKTTNSRI